MCEYTCIHTCVYYPNADEIDLHFKRSLAKARNQQPLPQHVQGTSLPTKKQVVVATCSWTQCCICLVFFWLAILLIQQTRYKHSFCMSLLPFSGCFLSDSEYLGRREDVQCRVHSLFKLCSCINVSWELSSLAHSIWGQQDIEGNHQESHSMVEQKWRDP